MKTVIEWCSHCEQEVKLKSVKYKLQECPNCGALIKACSLCNADKCKCKECDKNAKN